jgi:protease IV
MSFLNGNAISANDFKDGAKAYAVSPANTVTNYELIDQSIPVNSIAIIPISGVITSGISMRIESWIKMAESNPKIIGMLFMVNTPGGMVFYTDILAATIKNSPLPSVGYILQMAASAGMWLASSMGRRIISSPLDYLGSIGVMTTFMDVTALFDKIGIKSYDFYATASTRKNEMSRALLDAEKTLEEKQTLVAADLDYVNNFFHKAIQDNLGIDKDSEVFTGAMYYAPRAIELGLADEIGSFEMALDAVYKMGLDNKIRSISNNQNQY